MHPGDAYAAEHENKRGKSEAWIILNAEPGARIVYGMETQGEPLDKIIADGRLVNLAAGNGHPAEIMDMSFAVQALAAEWLVKHKAELETRVYDIPEEIDYQIGVTKLAALGLAIDALTDEQKAYLSGWEA